MSLHLAGTTSNFLKEPSPSQNYMFFFKGLLSIWLCEFTIIILSWLIKKTHKDLLKVLKVKFCHISKFIIKLNVQKVWDCWGKRYA